MRLLLTVLVIALAGCATKQTLFGPPDFQNWMRRALAQPNDNAAYHRFHLAYYGNRDGLHAYFKEALRQAESPEINVEAGEGLSWELQTIIHQIGDNRFAAALSGEPLPVRSAIASCFAEVGSPKYPRTKRLLEATPKTDFPMLQTSRGDYRPTTSPKPQKPND